MTGEGLGHESNDGVGRLVINRYRLLLRLGEGGMGTVWKARDERIQRDVAVKEPRLDQHLPEAERTRLFKRMEREARAAARIHHPGVVTILDVVMEDRRPWIVMEWVAGQSLNKRLEEGSLDPATAAQIALPVLEALSATHRAGVLHRDVKPDNVLIGPNGRVVLVDFGIARTEGEKPLTQTGGLVGSPNYIAPERVKGQKPTSAADLWSLGMLLFVAVEGWRPFERGDAIRTLTAVRDDPLPQLKSAGPLSELIVDLLQKEPSDRPTADQVAEWLKRVAGPKRTSPQLSPVSPTAVLQFPENSGRRDNDEGSASPRWWKRRRNQVLASVVAAAAAIALTLAWVFPSGSELPDGWTRHTPDGLHVKISTPGTYKQQAVDAGVVFNDPDKKFTVGLYRETGVRETALASAKSTKDRLAREGKDLSGRKADVNTVTIDEVTVQSKPAAALGFSYRNRSGPDVTTVFHRMDMIVVNDRGVRYWLAISMPSVGEAREKGERLYKDVLDHLEIDDL